MNAPLLLAIEEVLKENEGYFVYHAFSFEEFFLLVLRNNATDITRAVTINKSDFTITYGA